MVQKLADYLMENPLYAYGGDVMRQGSQTTPVHTWAEGLARALQGGVGGFFQGQGLRQARGEMELDRDALARAMKEPDAQKQMEILASRPGNADAVQSVLLQRQTLANQEELGRYKLKLQNDMMDADAERFGVGHGPTSSTNTPTQGGGVNPNNIGNVRGTGNQGFAQPADFNAGVQLAVNNAKAYPAAFNGGQPMNLLQIGQKWAPKGDGKNDPAQWAKNVATIGGLPLDQPLDLNNPQTAAQFARGVHGAEHGADKVRPLESYMMPGQAGGQMTAQNTPLGQPQQAANVQQQGSDTISFQGMQLPRAEVAAAMMIPDVGKRREKLAAIVGEATKRTPGTPEGDAFILNQVHTNPAIVNDPRYRAAYESMVNRNTKVSQGGQQVLPGMGAFPKPPGLEGQSTQQFVDTPGGVMEREQKLREEVAKDPAIKNYLQVKPIFEAMQAAKDQPSMAADTNMIAALANIYSPGSGSLPRGEMFKKLAEVESLPMRVRTAIAGLASGHGMDPEARQYLIDQAQTRMGPMQNEFNARMKQYTGIATSGGLAPERVLIMPAQETAPEKKAGGGPIKIDIHGNPL